MIELSSASILSMNVYYNFPSIINILKIFRNSCVIKISGMTMFFLSAKLEFGQNPKTESECAGARVATWDLGFWNRSRTSSNGRFLGWDGMGMGMEAG